MRNPAPAVPDPTVTFARRPSRSRGFRIRTAALIVAAAIGTSTAVRLDAVVIDDFEDGMKFLPGGGGLDYLEATVANGQMVWSGQFPGPFDPVQNGVNYDSVHWPSSLPTVSLQGRTLEVRMDLVSVSADDVILHFGAGGLSVGGRDSWYYISMDQNEIALTKGMDGMGEAVCFFTSAAITNRDATVSLAFTLMGDTLRLTTKVLTKSTGQVLFEKSFADGRGSDCPVPVPPPKGIPYYRADWGAPLTNLTYVWAGVSDTRTTLPSPPALEMVLDNLEYDLYDAPSLQIARSVLLSFSANTLEEQIVLGTDSVEGPWRPWPAPIYEQSDRWCMAAPITTAQQWTQPEQYFKLVPGRQFFDNFDPPKWPYTSKGEWVPYFYNPTDSGRFEVANTGNALRIRAVTAPSDGHALVLPPGPGVMVGDFCVTVDLLEIVGAVQNDGIGIGARGWLDPNGLFSGQSNGYIGGIVLYSPGKARLFLFDGENYDEGGPLFDLDPEADYRLQFSGVGNSLAVRVVNLKTQQAPVANRVKTGMKFQQGIVGLWVQAKSSSYAFTVDNFFVTGTQPDSP